MSALDFDPQVVSVTDAAKSGLPKLLRGVEGGTDVVVERHGKAVAAVVSMRHLAQIRLLEADLRETALLLAGSHRHRPSDRAGRRTRHLRLRPP